MKLNKTINPMLSVATLKKKIAKPGILISYDLEKVKRQTNPWNTFKTSMLSNGWEDTDVDTALYKPWDNFTDLKSFHGEIQGDIDSAITATKPNTPSLVVIYTYSDGNTCITNTQT